MEMNLEWVKDPRVFQVNRLDAHAFFNFYKDKEEYEQKNSQYIISLNGTWKFHYCERFNELIQGFEKVEYDCTNWDDIKVPGHIQMRDLYSDQAYIQIGTHIFNFTIFFRIFFDIYSTEYAYNFYFCCTKCCTRAPLKSESLLHILKR